MGGGAAGLIGGGGGERVSLGGARKPTALPRGVIRRLAGGWCVEAAGPIQHRLICVLGLISPRLLLITPLLLAIIPLLPRAGIGPRPLATSRTGLHFVYSSHLIRPIPEIRPVISSLTPEVGAFISAEAGIVVIVLLWPALLHRHQCRLRWVPQCIGIGDPDGLSQSGWHIPLQPLPQYTPVLASCRKPRNCL